jgi:glycosyltransferase involved in cell wall biosynthesis
MHALAPLIDRATTVCDFIGDELAESWGIDREKVLVIPTGVDQAKIDRGLDRVAARATLGVPEEAIVIGTSAMFRPVKRIEDLLDAAAKVAAEDPRVHVLIIGGGAWPPPYAIPEAILARPSVRQLGERIHFAGRIEGGAKLLRAFDIWVNCSIFEGSSNAILEAMAAERAVVATAVGGTPELIQDGVTGLLVAPENPDQLARALRTLVAHPERRGALARGAAARIRAQHGLSQMLERYAELYRSESQRVARSRATSVRAGAKGLLHAAASIWRAR